MIFFKEKNISTKIQTNLDQQSKLSSKAKHLRKKKDFAKDETKKNRINGTQNVNKNNDERENKTLVMRFIFNPKN